MITKQFTIEITCENEPFYNPDGKFDPAAELASILEHYCRDALRDGTTDSALFDTNGNRVGKAQLCKVEVLR